jgi:Tol biopolymer transport system component
VLSGHGDRVASAAYSPDGTRIVTASYDKTARIWEARTGAQLAVLSGHGDRVASAAYSPDGTRIVTASYDKTARIWEARTGAQLAVLSGHGDFVASAAYSPDGTRIVTASLDKTARIWEARTGAQLAVLSGHGGLVVSAAYSPDGTRIVTASDDKTARIWEARTGAPLAVLSGHSGLVTSAAYSPDGTRIVTASFDKTARIWEARTGAQLAVLSGHGDFVASAAYSLDGTRIVTASLDKTARIWEARTGTQLAVLSGHGDAVESAAYSPDGTRIVTASDDRTARVWDARVPATIVAQILWDAAAQTDPLPDVDRNRLGLLPDARVRKWSTHGSACDQAAAAFYDPDRLTPGLAQATIVADVANAGCFQKTANVATTPRLLYQRGRTLLAKSDVKGARQQFELAVSEGYRAARIDLANLLLDSSAGMLDPNRAVLLYEQAWQAGVLIAAFELGHLYEYGLRGPDAASTAVLPTDPSKAWLWYQKGADTGEPNALAQFAERDERNAAAETDPSKRNALLLQAFRFYAAAAERAHDEDWPDEAWRNWRYRRATLARLLAREGMMPQVADAYQTERDKWSPHTPTMWQTIAARLHL